MGDTPNPLEDPDAPAGTDDDNGTPPPEAPPADDKLAAAEAEIEKWKALSKKNEKELRKTQSDLDAAKAGSMSEVERAVAEAKSAARAETLAEILADRVSDKVKLAATGKLADPSDAEAMLGDLSEFIVSGEIDEKAIAKAVDTLVAKKPYLAAAPPAPGKGNGHGGPQGNPPANDKPKKELQKGLEAMLGISS